MISSYFQRKLRRDRHSSRDTRRFLAYLPKWDSIALEERTLLTLPAFIDPNPSPGNGFGDSIVQLSTGNVVVTSPYDDAGGTDAGAVYLFNGTTGALISTLRGSSAYDKIGNSKIIKLNNGNFLVCSPNWDNSTAIDAGAVTWGSGVSGISGLVSATNSLVGSSRDDGEGLRYPRITELSNGNYLVLNPFWDSGTATDAGAVTWCSGVSGVAGAVSANNSLVGSSEGDGFTVGNFLTEEKSSEMGIVVLANGNYVVTTPGWDNGSIRNVGAVTWGNGTSGVSGTISKTNSLIGTNINDYIGGGKDSQNCPTGMVQPLPNGNYVVISSLWDNGINQDAGAVTWCNGSSVSSGTISEINSLVGATEGDRIGYNGNGDISVSNIVVLPNSNYLVISNFWANGTNEDAGAVTWGSGISGVTGIVSAANSLVSSIDDHASRDDFDTFKVLKNGNYLVFRPGWNNGRGAVTWCSGTTGVSGLISASNSLVGAIPGDNVGWAEGVVELSNGNYVVCSPSWDNGSIVDVGAVTWCNGKTGLTGVVSESNSMIGSKTNDRVGDFFLNSYPGYASSLKKLTNGNYVICSPLWDNGEIIDAGAVTWLDGSRAISGVISAQNSLVGNHTNDKLGFYNGYFESVTALANGNYVVTSPYWDNGEISDAGAMTWGSGTTGVFGFISETNSVVGSSPGDLISGSVYPLSNGNYVMAISNWDNGSKKDAGAVTWGNGKTGVSGVISAANSLIGINEKDRVGWQISLLPTDNYLISSPYWDNGSNKDAGAVTWARGDSGVSGEVSAKNSLVGSSTDDKIGSLKYAGRDQSGIKILNNGNYLVSSPYWDNGDITDAGAVTWGSGTLGVSGILSIANSLVGSHANDRIGIGTSIYPSFRHDESFIKLLSNGNYVVNSPHWDNGGIQDAGAVTWGSGTIGVTGIVSIANSIIGVSVRDTIGASFYENGEGPNFYTFTYDNVRALSNGNYVISSPSWDNGALTDAGAVTWCDGTSGATGVISSANSAVGLSSNSNLSSLETNDDSDIFSSRFVAESGGVIRIGSQSTGFLTLQALSGTGQSATLNMGFANPLKTRVVDSLGNPVSGVTVKFSVPDSGASGTFVGGVTSAVTGPDGIATSAPFMANGQWGNYLVTASVISSITCLTTASFNLTNTPNKKPNLLLPFSAKDLNEGDSLQLVAKATDLDQGQKLTFALSGDVPAGMTINPDTGQIDWKSANGPESHAVTVVVKDNGTPAMSDSKSFTVNVKNVKSSGQHTRFKENPAQEGALIAVKMTWSMW